jgi:hypothetical protein
MQLEYQPIEDDLYYYEESYPIGSCTISWLSANGSDDLYILDKNGKPIKILNEKQRIGFI